MNKMIESVNSVIFDISKVFDVHISKEEVIKELDIWERACEAGKLSERYEYLLLRIENPLFILVFQLALAQYFYPPFYTILRECTGQGVTIHLALVLSGGVNTLDVLKLKEGCAFLKRILKTEKDIENFLYSELYADERLIMFLMGSDEPEGPLKGICRITEQRACCMEERNYSEEEKKLGRLVREAFRKQAVIKLEGKRKADRSQTLIRAYEMEGRRLLLVDLKRFKLKIEENGVLLKRLLEREMLFYGCDICYYYDGLGTEEYSAYVEELIKEQSILYGNILTGPIWVAAGWDFKISVASEIPFIKYIMEEADIKNEEELSGGEWEKAKRELGISLSRGNIPDIKAEGLQLIREKYCFEDMKIPARQMEKLKQLGNYLKYKNTVFNRWNMEEKYPYGKGITVLFAGPPGTGKTMAAGAIAGELKLPLYRVDLSAVMDKYIGETEKKLEQIFKSCESRNVILFFDEADVIFGKRSEIKDSKDKFANSSVSFMLQRIEEYDGMIILATNLKNNMDSAFLRRIKYVIPFHMPDADTRIEIWKSGFSKEIPTENIDIEFLGRKIELSGGYIKNIIINAVFMAAGDGGTVTMKHIIQSVENEYEKLGMLMVPEILENYGSYISGGRDKGGAHMD